MMCMPKSARAADYGYKRAREMTPEEMYDDTYDYVMNACNDVEVADMPAMDLASAAMVHCINVEAPASGMLTPNDPEANKWESGFYCAKHKDAACKEAANCYGMLAMSPIDENGDAVPIPYPECGRYVGEPYVTKAARSWWR